MLNTRMAQLDYQSGGDAAPERVKPGPGEQGFQLPEDAPWSVEAVFPKAEDRPKVIVSFAEKADSARLNRASAARGLSGCSLRSRS